jgi:phosphopantothenoylcysteine decarboxylase/phosphopantothenate--cysteine ligase
MRFLITAGPTREAIDPVRYLSNRSSGRMGYALAEAVLEAGHEVTLITGPVSIAAPAKANVVCVESAQQMFDAVREHLPQHEAAIFAAAVADYRPVEIAEQKLKKTDDEMLLRLERTPDILGSARSIFGFRGVLVGFAAETENLILHAQEKLARKGCDLLVANDVSQPGIGFDSSDNEVTLCFADGTTLLLPRASKLEIAHRIVREVTALHSQKHRDSAAD